MLYLIGLGLADEKDISIRGLEIVKSASRVYLEHYTAVLLVDKDKLESFYGRSVTIADRDLVESDSDQILQGANTQDVAFLVVGDPYSATTHADITLRARQLSIPVRVLPNASILNAIGATGLSLYNFGQTISLVFFTDSWKPTSFYDRMAENVRLGLHTLILLDIKVAEPSLENLARGRKIPEPPRFMTCAQAAGQLLEVIDLKGEQLREEGKGDEVVYSKESLVVGAARVGSEGQTIRVGTLEQMAGEDLGAPLHSLVLLGTRTHDIEREFLMDYAIDKSSCETIWRRDYEGKG